MTATTTARRRGRDVGVTIGLAGLVTYLVPAWAVHGAATRLASSRRVGESKQIERRSVDPSEVGPAMDAGSPVVFEGLLDDVGLTDAATPGALVSLAGDDEIEIAFHDAAAPFFLYSGGYGAEVRERRTMRVEEFVDLMFTRGLDPDVVVYRLLGSRELDGKVSGILDSFGRALRPVVARRGEPRFSGVWIGSPGVVTPLHHDAWPGLLFQTHGTKRVAMYAPTDRTNLYFRAPLRGEGRWSRLPGRSADASTVEFPRVARAVRWETVLHRGDALYIPPFWAHEMEAVEANVSVPFRFATSRRSYLDPGFLRPAAEMLRSRSDVRSGTR
jgi:hypothetical protein